MAPVRLIPSMYAKRPGQVRLDMGTAPQLLRNYPQIAVPWPVSAEDYVMARLPDVQLDGRTHVVLDLQRKQPAGDLLGLLVWMDAATFRSSRRLYNYRGNGTVDVRYAWRGEDANLVIESTSTLDLPSKGASATIRATCGSFKFNQGLQDDVFRDQSKAP